MRVIGLQLRGIEFDAQDAAQLLKEGRTFEAEGKLDQIITRVHRVRAKMAERISVKEKE
jgi:hypothetical protein